jgi:hypothetical protein
MTSTPNKPLLVVETDPMAGIIRSRASLAPTELGLANWLATGVAMDALELGCADVVIKKADSWVLVGAEANWVTRGAGAGLEIAEAFRSLLPLLAPEKRTSSSPTRHEGWVRVYARDITVVDGDVAYRIKGDDMPEECRALAITRPFWVVFRVASETTSPQPRSG